MKTSSQQYRTRVSVTGASMMPFVPPGSEFEIERVVPEKLTVGDIVCFIDDVGGGKAHRIVRIDRERDGIRIFASGDAQRNQEELPSESIIYIVRRVIWRRVSYATDGSAGQLFARIVRSPFWPRLIVVPLAMTTWRGLLKIRQLMRK